MLAIGSDAIAMAPTVDGRINALDVKVFQLFEAPIEPLNDKMIEVPFKFAQSLYDTTSVDRLIVFLDETEQTASMRAALAKALEERGLHVEVKTWEELSPFYTKAKDMFDIISLFILIIVVMSVINTIGMAVIERTREIGTLRAPGVKRGRVVSLFATESAALGIFGSILDLGLTMAGWFIVMTILQPTWVPPHITRRVPLEVIWCLSICCGARSAWSSWQWARPFCLQERQLMKKVSTPWGMSSAGPMMQMVLP